MRAKLFFAFIFIFFIAAAHSALAVSVSIISFPQTINQDPFTLTASVSGASAGTNYLRIDIYKDGTDNYFGETYGTGGFYSGSTYTQYLPITIQSGTFWSGDIQAKIGSPSQTEYDGQGSYKMRIRRYTESGGTNATEANASAVSVSVNLPIPTSTPVPPTASPKSTPTSTPIPTATTVINKIPLVTPKLTSKPSPKTTPQVLGENTDNIAPTIEPTVEVLADSENPITSDKNFIPKVFISIGIVFLILCGIVISYPIIKKVRNENTNE